MSTGSPSQPESELVAHERAYKGFNVLLRWCMVLLAASISGLTLWFATPAGFAGGITVAIVLLLAGYLFLVRHEAHQPLDPWQSGR